jgi:hypothetical protein
LSAFTVGDQLLWGPRAFAANAEDPAGVARAAWPRAATTCA